MILFFSGSGSNYQLFASPICGKRQLRDERHDVRAGRDALPVHPGFTLRKLRGGPSRAVVPDVLCGRLSELHECNPWRQYSATPHPGSCQRSVEDPRPAKVSRTWRGAEVHVLDVRRRLLHRLHEL